MKRFVHPDKINRTMILIVVVFFAINGVFFVTKYLGYAAYDQARAGTITEIDIQYKEPATTWAGVYGVAIYWPSYNNSISENIYGNDMFERNLIFQCLEDEITNEVYASLVNSSQIDWDTLHEADPTNDVDIGYLGFLGTELMSATKTYTQTSLITIGGRAVNFAPTAFTYEFGSPSPYTKFNSAVLIDNFGNLVYATNIYTSLISGFNGRAYNYQLLIPVLENTTETYYFFTDPYDECPEGIGATGDEGNLTGNVTSESGVLLEDVIISIAGRNVLSDPSGNYFMQVPAGTHNIIAIKENFQTYYNTINITADNTTIHNIVMLLASTDTGPGQTDYTGPGVGPGQSDGDGDGQGIGPYIEKPAIEGQQFVLSIPHINKRLKIGNFLEEIITLYSFQEAPAQLEFEFKGNISEVTRIDKDRVILNAQESDDVKLTFYGINKLGIYNGTLVIKGSFNEEIPIRIEVTDKDLLTVQALDIDIQSIDKVVYPGGIFKFRTLLRNLLIDESFPVNLVYTISELNGNKTIWASTENLQLTTTFTLLKSVRLERTLPPGSYVVKVRANYLEFSSIVSDVFEVKLPFYLYMVFGKFPLWYLFLALAILLLLALIGYLIYRDVQSKKKYHLKVEYAELPKPGPRNVYVGKIAETDRKTYFNLENFKTHTIVAGSTGGGKSFSAQGIIEEMLLNDVAVIVFDPTAQWTGFLRKLKSKNLLNLYPIFGMKKTEAKAFNGNIKMIENPRELLDIKKYMKPGEIQVFACHKLDPRDMDTYVSNAIKEVFHGNFDESPELRLMIVFDEIHRILPKFGGSGAGFLQIERGCREFRKWGIGIMLISQVLSDFVGEIKANINTEIQMRTRDEGDLERIATKYGKELLRSLVKATVGSGMVENPAYNRGRPYFVSFKPLRHSVERLSDDDIEKYNKYNAMIDQIDFEIKQLEEDHSQDVFDLKLELKLSSDKVKSGNFNMVDIYLEGLKPRITKLWQKIGQTPKKYEVKLATEEDLAAELEKAKAERAEAEAKEQKEEDQKQEEAPKVVQKTSLDLRVDFQSAFSFPNGQQVTNIQELLDVLPSIGAEEFSKVVSKEKNQIADWLQKTLGVVEFANKARPIVDHDELVAAVDHEVKNPTKIKMAPKPQQPPSKQLVAQTPIQKPKEAVVSPQKPITPPVASQTPPQTQPPKQVDKPVVVEKKEEVAKPEPKPIEQVPTQKEAEKKEENQPPQLAAQVVAKEEPKPLVQVSPQEEAQKEKKEPELQAKEVPVQEEAQEVEEDKKEEPKLVVTQESTEVPKGDLQGAVIEKLEAKEELKPEPILTWPEIKKEYKGLESTEEKIKYLIGQEEFLPNEPNVKFALGLEYHKNQDYVNAEIKYSETINLIPNNTKVLLYLATAQELRGKTQDAISNFERVLEVDPSNEKAKQHLEKLAIKTMGIAA
ncbi:DUF87 domain-containing protein [Candidatus Woesearchaeota archaeon]|nr:DUF87 domain-containing protein [Candidatus Woesearchaeota archaeon]